MGRVYVALLHYPVYDRKRRSVSTSLTSTDVHDISRSCRTYGVHAYYIVQPLRTQYLLAKNIAEYWQRGPGGAFNANRKDALELVRATESIDQMQEEILNETGAEPIYIATDAKRYPWSQSFTTVREKIKGSEEPFVLVFGTGDGLDESVIMESDILLEPIEGPTDYNHLSVRAAAAIILDRLFRVEP